MKIRTLLMVSGALFLVPLSVHAAERLDADVSCRATDRNLVYDCTIVLKGRKSGQPIEGAEIAIFADMPSMPMAHNVPPVTAEAASKPGVYRARIRIEMLGDWTLRLQISGSVRDLIVKRLESRGTSDPARHSAYKGYYERYTGFADQHEQALVARGKLAFDEFCAVCHGAKLEGESALGAAVPDGVTPAPPLNGSTHSHHHADGELFGVVKHGPGLSRANRPPRMPAFDRVLPDDDIWATIAYIKSAWPKHIQAQHAKSFPPVKEAKQAE